ncbi:TVP38/TMEM64 family protein [candidate division KSB1 bacterium]|nr:TVP38/TMEM64 family protein [candidate division KSB1 bacterium]
MKWIKQVGGKNWLKLGLLAALAALVVLVFHLSPLELSDFKPENVKQFILGFGAWGPLVFIIIYALRAVILVLPVGVMSLAGGLAFGKWFGTLYILIGATLGASLSFLIARYFGRSFIQKLGVMKQGRLQSFDEGTEKNGFRFILFMRLIPLFQYDAVNFGSGFSRMKFRDFAIGSFVGMAPGGFINALLGSSLENIISVQFFAALGFFLLLMFVPGLYKKWKAAKSSKPDQEVKVQTGECPGCGQPVGGFAILRSWTHWGRFVCPGCGGRIGFGGWLGLVSLLTALFIGMMLLLRWMMILDLPLVLGFGLSTLLALGVMFVIPRFWKVKSIPE